MESDIEKEMVNLLKNKKKLYFVACSSQNIDRLVSVYRACLKTDRIFIIDPYTAFVLDKLKILSSKIPQYNWNNMKIFFVPNTYTDRMAEGNILYKFKSAKISYEDIESMRNNLVIKDTYKARNIFAKRKALTNTELIYSMWEGYLNDMKLFWDKHGVPIIQVHSSGHAYIEELKSFVQAVKPKYIIPNHTFYPEKYLELMGNNVMLVKDKQPMVL